jgi:hypothetical protein
MKLMESGKMEDTTESTGSADSTSYSGASAPRPEDVIPSAARGDTLSPTSARDLSSSPRSEESLHAILVELRRQREGPSSEFSINQLLAVITQVLALGLMTMAIIFRTEESSASYLMFAIMLQVLTIALLMWRGKAS